MFFVVRRATLLIPSGPPDDPNRKHLFVCLTDPIGPGGDILLVSISTFRQGESHDPTCRLFPGDHPFIRRESYVNYRFARIEPASKIERGVQQGVFIPQQVLDGAIFARVCNGLAESRFVTPQVLAFYAKAPT